MVFYRLFRAVVSAALRAFYRVQLAGASPNLGGPVIFVGNHPNGLIDPGLIFVLTRRHLTFLAKEPLFRIPVIGAALRALGALPVFRRQDDPSQAGKNEATVEASVSALVAGRAIALFPEGKSHSEPHLVELKTGCARIALRAAHRGARVRIVPIGFTYENKPRFRSAALIEVGEPIEVADDLADSPDDPESVRALTDRIAASLRRVTLNLDRWEDLPVLRIAEELYAAHRGGGVNDPELLRAFAQGLRLLRDEQPDRVERLRRELSTFGRRVALVRARPRDLALVYRPRMVAGFTVRNLAALLLGFPLFLVGVVLFAIPYLLPRWVVRAFRVAPDVEATVKVLLLMLLVPVWAALLASVAWAIAGPLAAMGAVGVGLPLAVFTRYFLERRAEALQDARTFFVLGSRPTLKAKLLAEGERLAQEIEQLAEALGPRLRQAGLETQAG